jgi:hypothetical protein
MPPILPPRAENTAGMAPIRAGLALQAGGGAP